MQRLAFAALAVLAFACDVDTGEDPIDGPVGGAGGASSGGAQGTTGGTGGTGGAMGTTGGTGGATGGSGGTGGATGGTGGATGGAGGALGGSAGKGGTAGEGGEPAVGGSAGMGTGGSVSGAGGGAGTAAAGTSSTCSGDIRCQLDAPASTGDPHQDCVNRINQFRTECACLPPLERWTDGEACANQMAEYDSGEDSAHAGFQAGICEGGSAQNECPGWRSEEQVVDGCLQAMWDEGPPPMDPCNGDCFQEYGHFINMTNTRYTKVACGFFTGSDVWAVQNFSR